MQQVSEVPPEVDQPDEQLKQSFLNFLKKPLTPVQAVITGLVVFLGVGLVGCLVFKPKKPELVRVRPTPVIETAALTLLSPSDGMIATGNEIEICGKTKPNSMVVFYTESDENSAEVDSNGNFEGTIMLESGINTLTVTAFFEDGEEESISLDLVYDEEQVLGKKDASGQAKKEEKQNKAIVGEVEEVTSDSVVIRQKKEKKEKTKVDKETKIINQQNKHMKLENIRKKDKAAIIATESGKGKKAIKIYVRQATSSAQIRQSKRRAVHGVITGINGGVIILAHQIHRERIYSFMVGADTYVKIKDVESATVADLEVGQRVAAVGDLNENGIIVAKRVHVIPGRATGIFKKQPLATDSAEATPAATITVSPTATPTAEVLTPTIITPAITY